MSTVFVSKSLLNCDPVKETNLHLNILIANISDKSLPSYNFHIDYNGNLHWAKAKCVECVSSSAEDIGKKGYT